MRFLALFAFLPLACQASAQSPTASGVVAGPSMESDPTIVSALLKLMDVKDSHRPVPDPSSQAWDEIIRLGTPQGLRLLNRFYWTGATLSEVLATADDPRLKEQMLELARWDRQTDIRSVALVTLAGRHEAEHGKYFNEALNNPKFEVRFAALEALQVWNKDPDVKQMLEYVIRSETQPMLKVYAAQALWRRGGEQGREEVLRQLDAGAWLTKAMAARFVGELGKGEDYDNLLGRIDREQSNDFVVAELAIACLKLFPKRTPAAFAPPPPGSPPVAGGDDIETLEITAPRLKIPATALIDGRINAHLLRLLEKSESLPPPTPNQQAARFIDPEESSLKALDSPVGNQLKRRYTTLSFLLAESLAGTSDLILRDRILKAARQHNDPQVRAAALVALAYNKDPNDRSLFQEAMLAQNLTVRFGAVEALQVWKQPGYLDQIASVARMDLSNFLQVYAAGILWRSGDSAGRDIIIRRWDDVDSIVRALAVRYLGELGAAEDYSRILFQLDREQDKWVKAEMAGALLRLNRLRKG